MNQIDKPMDRSDKFVDQSDKLNFALARRQYHHNALWEEEKHFTWVQSIILASQAAVLLKPLAELPTKGIILFVLGAIGLLFARIALQVLRREKVFFTDANDLFVREFNEVFPEDKIDLVKKGTSKKDNDMLSTAGDKPAASQETWFRRWRNGKLTIQENFELVFNIFAVVNALLIIGVLVGMIYAWFIPDNVGLWSCS